MKITHKDGTGTSNLKFLIDDRDRHGNVRIYVRIDKKKIRIREEVGTPKFFLEYQTALTRLKSGVTSQPQKGLSIAARGTFLWLLQQYFADEAFKGSLSERTQYVRRGILDRIASKHGAKRYAQLESRHIFAMRNDFPGKPEAYNAAVKALRQLFKWAIPRSLANNNPAQAVPYLAKKGNGHHTWTDDDMQKFEDRHAVGTMPRLAYDLMRFTGMRKGDAVRAGFGWISGDGEHLTWVEAKNRERKPKTTTLPLLQPLRTSIAATSCGKETFLITEFGKPFSINGFGNWFRKRCNEAGLRHCSAHGIRKATASIGAEHGASEQELMAFHGWQNPKQAADYTKKVNRKALAESAAVKILNRRK